MVDPTPRLTGVGGEHIDERSHVVLRQRLALIDGGDGERRRANRLELGRGRPLHLLAGGDLDLAPELHPRRVGPQRAELRACVALDH